MRALVLGRSRFGWGLALWLCLGTSVVSLPGCDDEGGGEADGDAAPAAGAKKKKKKGADAPEAEAKPAAAAEPAVPEIEYVYNPVARRDPFKSSVGVEVQVDNRPTTPLQKYDLDQYKVVGVIFGEENPVAMVQDPEGNGHFLKAGTLIGRNWGKVARINIDSVVVAEEYRDFTGQLMVNEIVLALPDVATN